MSNKTDRTKEHIQQVFFAWMKEIGLNKITIAGLAKRAKINRGTFYLYYPDKYAVLQEVEEEIYSEVEELMEKHFSGKFQSEKRIEVEQVNKEFHYLCYQIMLFFYEKREFLSILLGRNGDPYFIQKIEHLYVDSIQKKRASVDEYQMDHRTYHMEFIFSGIIAIFKSWIQNEAKETPEEILEILVKCMEQSPFDYIEEWSN